MSLHYISWLIVKKIRGTRLEFLPILFSILQAGEQNTEWYSNLEKWQQNKNKFLPMAIELFPCSFSTLFCISQKTLIYLREKRHAKTFSQLKYHEFRNSSDGRSHFSHPYTHKTSWVLQTVYLPSPHILIFFS